MQDMPQCIGIILDGNRRWATERGLPKLEGHRKGVDTLVDCIKHARDKGVHHVAVFLFSTENWHREQAEVDYLMDLFYTLANDRLDELKSENVRVRFVGQLERFSPKLQDVLLKSQKETEQNTGITLWACLSYGGRAEIAAAAKAASDAGEAITEESIAKHLWTAEMPDPDLIIRTSGEQRLSGFLTWKGVYSELFFVDTKWPDFDEARLDAILEGYQGRQRRMGR